MIHVDGFASLPDCRTWLFDCDGVLLDSNAAKSEAFREAAMIYGEEIADALLAYHQRHGGISRFEKFRYLFSDLLGRPAEEGELDRVLGRFAESSRRAILTAPVARGLPALLDRLDVEGSRRLVVSGGAQSELRGVFEERELADGFAAIFGSPDDKMEIVERELSSGLIEGPVMFVGDSRYDFETAARFGFHFLFLTGWSEFDGWQHFFRDKDVFVAESLAAISD